MYRFLLKISILLGFIFSLISIYGSAIAEGAEAPATHGTELSGMVFTTGLFLNEIRDDHYAIRNKKIIQEVQGNFDRSLGGLAHLPVLIAPEYNGFRAALALSAGVGIDGPNLTDNLQVAVGPSLLFNTENYLLAFTWGKVVRSVQRLNYCKDAENIPADVPLTKSVLDDGYFWGFTASFDLVDLIKSFGSRGDDSTNQDDTANDNDPANGTEITEENSD